MNGFIFDMDNTLLQSKIDFYKMKKEVYTYLRDNGFLRADYEWESKTASQLIEIGRKQPHFHHHEVKIWQLITDIEVEGMRGATLTPDASAMLSKLRADGHCLTILTNNARGAALQALQGLAVADYFDFIAGREQMSELKPSPSGVYAILERFAQIPKERWVLVGDSWIDGKAANEAGIAFMAYRADQEKLKSNEVYSIAHLNNLLEISDHFSG